MKLNIREIINKCLFMLILLVSISCQIDQGPKGKKIFNFKTSLEVANEFKGKVTHVDVRNNTFTLTGENLDQVNQVNFQGPGVSQDLTIVSQTTNTIVANSSVALNFLVDYAYQLLIGNAWGQVAASVTFQLTNDSVTTNIIQDNAVTAAKLSDMGAADGDVLKYDSGTSTWITAADVGAGAGGGTVTNVNRGRGIVGNGTSITVAGSVAVDTGTTANKIVEIDGTGNLVLPTGVRLNLLDTISYPATREFSMYNDGTWRFYDETDALDRMTIDAAGNVDIVNNLSVQGTALTVNGISVCQQDGTNCPTSATLTVDVGTSSSQIVEVWAGDIISHPNTIMASSGGKFSIQNSGAAQTYSMDTTGTSFRIYDETNTASRMEIANNGDVNFDSNTLVVDATNNLVGIGTAAPTASLTISGGQLLVTGEAAFGNVAANASNRGVSIQKNFINIGDNTATYNLFMNSTRTETTPVTVLTDHYGIWNQATTSIPEGAGSVRAIGLRNDSLATGTATYYNLSGISNSAQSTSTATTGQDYLYGVNNQAILNAAGTVGTSIGAINQSWAAAGGTITSGYGAQNYTYISGTANMTSSTGALNSTHIAGTGNMGTAYGSYNQVRNLDTTGTGNITTGFATYSNVSKAAGALDPTTSYLYFGTTSAGTTKWGMYLTGEDKNYFSGSIGIGTTVPSRALHINNASSSGQLQITDGVGTFRAGTNTTGQGVIVMVEAQPLRFFTTNTERMRIDASGYVGIGTTTATASLVVVGEIRSSDIDGNNRLWGQGRPDAGRFGTGGLETTLCTNGSISFGLSKNFVDWGAADSACPSGTWVCTSSQRGVGVCDTSRTDAAVDGVDWSGSAVDWAANSHIGWVADSSAGTATSCKNTSEQGVQADYYCSNSLPVWCCSE